MPDYTAKTTTHPRAPLSATLREVARDVDGDTRVRAGVVVLRLDGDSPEVTHYVSVRAASRRGDLSPAHAAALLREAADLLDATPPPGVDRGPAS